MKHMAPPAFGPPVRFACVRQMAAFVQLRFRVRSQ
jgi:hypothetical protein